MSGLHVQKLKEELVSRLVILLLIYIEDLVLLVLEVDLKAVQSGDLIFLLN